MLNRDQIRTVTMAITNVDQAIGSNVPINMRRFIYRYRWVSTFNGLNAVAIGSRENGAGATTWLDGLTTVVIGQMETDPEDLNENSAPLVIINGPAQSPIITPVGNTTVRAMCTETGQLVLWYIDAPA